MDLGNYKINVTTEAESKEAQELFFELGYYWNTGLGVKSFSAKFLYVKNSQITMGFCYGNFSDSNHCELTLHQLRDFVAQSKNKQCLISGADALRALADGREVEFHYADTIWALLPSYANISIFYDDEVKFRLKPRTITLNIEIPAPFEPKNNEIIWILNTERECGYKQSIHHVGVKHDLVWKSEHDIQQVVSALRGALKNG